MKIDNERVKKNIAQIRSEMRYFQARPLPNYNANAASSAMEELQEQVAHYGVKLRLEGIGNLERLKVVKELNKLHDDLSTFNFQGEKPTDQEAAESGKFPIIQSLKDLAETLQHSQPQRKPPRVVKD